MKRSCIIALFSLFLPFFTISQNYIPLVDTNSVWQCSTNDLDFYKFRISGDTTIYQVYYKKLYQIYYDTHCSKIVLDSSFIGGIREDVDNKKVYYHIGWPWDEELLYDFNLEVGDTVPPTYNNFNYPEMYVSAVDSILCADGYRKRFIYSTPTYFDIEVIEGIGAYTGLVDPMKIFEHFRWTRCFYNNDNFIYMNPYVDNCYLDSDTCIPVGIARKYEEEDSFDIVPNPASSIINLVFQDHHTNRSYFVDIFDVFGRPMDAFVVSAGQKRFLYDITGLPNGLYFALIKQSNRLVSKQKFIVWH